MRETGDRHREGITVTKLGIALYADGQTDTARRCWRDAIAILEGLASPRTAKACMLLTSSMQVKSAGMALEFLESHILR